MADMDLISQLSWSAYFEQRGNQQKRRSLGKWLLEEGGGCAWCMELERGEVEEENMLQGSTADLGDGEEEGTSAGE